MADLFGTGFIWPLAAGTPADPTVAYIASTKIIQLLNERHLSCNVLVTVADCTAIELLFEESIDGETTWRRVHEVSIPGAVVGVHRCSVDLPEASAIRVSARRLGGTAASRLSVSAEARPRGQAYGRNRQPIELEAAQDAGVLAWHDGAGVADSLTAAYVAGDWVPVGPATEATLNCAVDTPVALASVDIQIDVTPDEGTTVTPVDAINNVAGGIIDRDDNQNALPATAGNHMLRFTVEPGTRVRASAKRTGNGANLLAILRLYKV